MSPESLNVTQLTPTKIHVEWSEIICSNQNGMITNYIVCLQEIEASSETCVQTMSTGRVYDEFVTSGVSYSVTVAAVNNAGTGPFSGGVIIQTEEDGKEFSSADSSLPFLLLMQRLAIHLSFLFLYNNILAY